MGNQAARGMSDGTSSGGGAGATTGSGGGSGTGTGVRSSGRSPQRGRPTVNTRQENGVVGGTYAYGEPQATPKSSTSGRYSNKKYRHYSADWVLKKNEMAPVTQRFGADPLLVAHMDDVNESDEANLYDSDVEYDSDFDVPADKDTDLQYIQDRVDIDTDRIDDHSRLTYNRPEAIPTSHLRGLASTMKRSRSRAKLAKIAAEKAAAPVYHHKPRGGAGILGMIGGEGSNATMPLSSGDVTVVLPLQASDIGAADHAWQHRHFEPKPNEVEILVAFMSGAAEALVTPHEYKHVKDTEHNQQLGRLLLQAHKKLLENKLYRDVDMHAIAEREEVLQAYMYAKHRVMIVSAESDTSAQLAPVKESALLYQASTGQARLGMTFGGQGYNWLYDFTSLYVTYPQLHTFAQSLIHVIQQESTSMDAQTLGLYTYGFDVLEWMKGSRRELFDLKARMEGTRPPAQYITSAPISYPMVGVTQLCNYYMTLRNLDKTPSEFNSAFQAGGITGHSQGIVPAIVAAASDTLQDFTMKSIEAVKYLFWHGARTQQVQPLQQVPFKILQESLSKSFGQPTPMLSIRGLDYETVQQHVDTVNKGKNEAQKIYISLVNGPTAVNVSGQPLQLHQLRQLLSSIQADDSMNQNRVPFSQRKLSFTCRYLPISVPFHSPLTKGSVELIEGDCKRLNIMQWSASSLRQPVWHTHDISDLRSSKNLIHDVIRMQTVESVDWKKLCDEKYVRHVHPSLVANADKEKGAQQGCTHVVDFGPGGGGGTSRLTLDSVEGSGCQPITMDQLRGSEVIAGKYALYESRDSHVPYANNWYEQYAPKLVKRSNKLVNQGFAKQPQERKHAEEHDHTDVDVNSLILESKFTKTINKPIVMVPGMTPSTVTAEFTAAICQAGYHVELAGGGQHTEQIFRNRVDQVSKMIPVGMGFSVNLLFLNAYLWKFQFPLVVQLRKEGYPLDGITIGAGVPSPEMSDNILADLRSVGIYNLGLKPGSIESIEACRDIAIRNPESNIIIQWTGGRAGGHHSCEDQHQPMLDTYASIREIPNVVLICGGGIGDHTSAMYYLSGEWSLAYGRQPMPFDGVLCGSRLMVAKECPTAPTVKKLIASLPGVPDDEWENSFNSELEEGAGGVITILSELGEPIHKVSNRGMRLWRLFDNKYFSLPRDKIGEAVAQDKWKIIESLNNDFQKPFFPRKEDGTVVEDLREMTYIEVAKRLLEVFYLPPVDGEGKPIDNPEWIDVTYTMRWNDWVVRVCERFANTAPGGSDFDIYSLLSSGKNPYEIVDAVAKQYPQASKDLLQPEDSTYFLSLSKRVGKPVNYVPIVDADLKFWLKKDSLWFAEDLRSVPGHDAEKVAILQGPVSTRFSQIADEPAASILDGIHNGLKQTLLKQLQATGELDQIETQKSVVLNPAPLRALVERYHIDKNNVHTRSNAEELIQMQQALQSLPESIVAAFNIPENDPNFNNLNEEYWLQMLSGLDPNWRRAVMLSQVLLRNTLWLQNQMMSMFLPKLGQTVVLSATHNQANAVQIDRIRIYDSNMVKMGLKSTIPVLELLYDINSKQVSFILRHPRTTIDTIQKASSAFSELTLNYKFVTDTCASVHGALMEQPWADRCTQVLKFYRSLWLTEDDASSSSSSTQVLSADDIRRFKAAIGDYQHSASNVAGDFTIVADADSKENGERVVAPLDYGIVVAWEAICQALISGLSDKYGNADLLSLVHLSNEYIIPSGHQQPPQMRSGDRVTVGSQLTGVWDEAEGRVITVTANIRRTSGDKQHDKQQAKEPEVLQTIVSRFAIPPRAVQTSPDQMKNLYKTADKHYQVTLKNNVRDLLLSKKWHNLTAEKLKGINVIILDIHTEERLAASKPKGKETRLNVTTKGNITLTNGVSIGKVDSVAENVLKDIVLGFLTRHGKPTSNPVELEQKQYYPVTQLTATGSNLLYAMTSKDVNPIHTNTYAVSLAGLPDTIVHGMHSSAKCRQILSALAAGSSNVAYTPVLTRYKAVFMGMVMPKQRTTAITTITHMENGERVLTLELRDRYDGSMLMKATGHVQQPPTAYLFTGQGSAVVGMGMDLYNQAEEGSAVRAVWDEADNYFLTKYGFSIMQIVKENPKTLTVSLTGSKGTKWRENYAKLTVNKPKSGKGSKDEIVPLFPEAQDPLCQTITFRSVDGLLFQTQFQQPAILLSEKAFFEYINSHGVIARNSAFAGHSLGEYGAICAMLGALSISGLAEVVFLRGLTMQSAVPRDEQNRSRYGMVAVSPIRVNPWFNERALEALIELLCNNSKDELLLQIVNYNTLGTQYVCAGHVLMLEALRLAIDDLTDMSRKMMKQMLEKEYGKDKAEDTLKKAQKSGWPSDMPQLPLSEDEIKELFNDIAKRSVEAAQKASEQSKDGYLPIKRGTATVPLPGIDVPFHSKLLVDGVPSFRKILQSTFGDLHLSPDDLNRRYLPNLLGVPFELSLDFVKQVYEKSKSPIIKEVIDNWSKKNDKSDAETRENITRDIMIELLAYQFASPVQWITTQAELVKHGYRRFIEIGPSPVLTTMLKRGVAETLGKQGDYVEILFSGRDEDTILGKNEASPDEPKVEWDVDKDASGEGQQEKAAKRGESKAAEKEKAPPREVTKKEEAKPEPKEEAPPKQQEESTSGGGGGGGGDSDSVPLSVLHATRVIIGMKLKMPFSSVDSSKSVRALAGGKSAIQNEILGDLSAEFKTEPEGADELPLVELATKLGGQPYEKPGKVLSGHISSLGSRVFPGGYGMGKAKEYLKSAYGVDEPTIYGIQTHMLTVMPPNRMSSESEATEWIDKVVKSYADSMGGKIQKKSSSSGGGGGGGGGGQAVAAIDPKEMKRIKELFAQQEELFHAYLKADKKPKAAGEEGEDVQAKERLWIDTVENELGEKFISGIQPTFDERKQRDYDSHWAWIRVQTVKLLTKLQSIIDKDDEQAYKEVEKSIDAQIRTIENRAVYSIYTYIKRFNENNTQKNSKSSLAQSILKYTKPLEETLSKTTTSKKEEENVQSKYRELEDVTLPVVTITDRGEAKMRSEPRYKNVKKPGDAYREFVNELILDKKNDNRYILELAINMGEHHDTIQNKLDEDFAASFKELAEDGLSFSRRTALITGAGEGSIGAEVAKRLLQGGAHVIITTSRPNKKRWDYYRQMYKDNGGKGSRLTVLPYNAASLQDTNNLVNYLFDEKGLAMKSLDYCLPFAAIPEAGQDVTNLGPANEVAHRCMLINVHRLIGNIITKLKEVLHVTSPQTVFMLPMSPNHGLFGGDGLYAESKIGLETLFHRWRSEGWGDYCSVVGCIIGWTRGTGLMSANDIVAQDMERMTGLRTFGQQEMAFSIVGLFNPRITALAARCPIKANYTGGFHLLAKGGTPVAEIRQRIQQIQNIKKLIFKDYQEDVSYTGNDKYMLLESEKNKPSTAKKLNPRAHLELKFPPIPSTKPQEIPALNGLLDLSTTVVCVGYGEVGPWGSSRCRWERELFGKFSMEGAIELCRSMGLIKFHVGQIQGQQGEYVGWIDAKEKKPLADHEILPKFEEYIYKHCGIREVEPELFDGYDPYKKMFIQQMALEADMPPFEITTPEEAEHLKARHGENIEIIEDGDSMKAKLKQGAVIYVPKYRQFNRTVASQIPTGWNPESYGIPKEIAGSVDPVTKYALAATMDAFATAGITDPFEFYKYCHVSEVGNTTGGGMGGMESMKAIFRKRFMEMPNLSSDLLQETFINTTPAWVNMLLLSSSGPIKTPVGACATAAVSVELGCESIKSGKARVIIAGGTEDFGEEGSYEFAQMQATSNSLAEYEKGRPATEHSRPATSTRAGFMESQGAGIHILCSADLAIEMGLPIYAVIAATNTATDRQGRSIPAPGRGILSTAKENQTSAEYSIVQERLVSVEYRAAQLQREVQYLESVRDDALKAIGSDDQSNPEAAFILNEHQRRVRGAQFNWGNAWWVNHTSVAPLRAALATYGLTIDDLEACSFHGTSTKANDKNESAVVQAQQTHLGRKTGNPLYTIWQKWLTGHPKGSAAAWMFNGLIQAMHAGIVPPNENLDSVGNELSANTYLLYSDEAIHLGRPLKAAYLHSFGFGQAGGQVVIVHPNYLFNAINDNTYGRYREQRAKRELNGNRHWLEYMCGEHGLTPIKDRAPYEDKDAETTYLNPLARAGYDEELGGWKIMEPDVKGVPPSQPIVTSSSLQGSSSAKSGATKSLQYSMQSHAKDAAKIHPSEMGKSASASTTSGGGKSHIGIGVDVEEISSFDTRDETFMKRNYTEREISDIESTGHRSSSLAGRWCAKEAIVKALSSYAESIGRGSDIKWGTPGSALNGFEIISSSSGAPAAKLYGYPADMAQRLGVSDENIHISISYTREHAIAQVTIVGQ